MNDYIFIKRKKNSTFSLLTKTNIELKYNVFCYQI